MPVQSSDFKGINRKKVKFVSSSEERKKKNTKKLNLNYANNTKIYLEKGIEFGKNARM